MTINRLRFGRCFPTVGAATLAALSGCASSTVLQTQPPGARVTINGIVVGQTPYRMTDTKTIFSSTPVRFEYPGYATIDVLIPRTEEVAPLPLIAGFFCLIPWLWAGKYREAHMYTLEVPGAYAPNAWAPPPAQPGYPPQPPQGDQPPVGPAGYPPPPPGYPPAAQ
jgi:hypothetical protein